VTVGFIESVINVLTGNFLPPASRSMFCAAMVLACFAGVATGIDGETRQEESQRQATDEAVTEDLSGPAGVVEGPFTLKSLIYPGTHRDYWLYVPAQYEADKPACCLVVQDGQSLAEKWRIKEILDRLIGDGQMPITIGIFVDPGVVPSHKTGAPPRFNRSVEYDSLGDTYARFLIEELLPEVSGRYNLSNDPNHRGLAGMGSGAVCAFNAAWERPDSFRRVFSASGSFVGLRGAHEMPVMIRKMEPRPVKVFLQADNQDLNIHAGDWWLANQDMLSALQWAGYDVQHNWLEGVSGDSPETIKAVSHGLQWLWRDIQEPIPVAPKVQPPRRIDVLIPGNGWQQISSGHESVDATTCNALGVLFFSDSRAGRIYRMGDDNRTRIFKESPSRISAMRFGPDEKLYMVRDNKQIIRVDGAGVEEVLVNEQRCHRLITLPEGFFFSDDVKNKIYWSTYAGQFHEAVSLADRPVAMVATPDQGFLNLAIQGQQSLVNFVIGEDFSLRHRQRFGHLHMPYLDPAVGVTAMVVDDQGRTFVATSLGIQVLDQMGRVHVILSRPSRAPITGLVIGGPLRDTLFASDGQSVYARKMKIKGVDSFGPPLIPPPPAL
jgi:gluconolactonase